MIELLGANDNDEELMEVLQKLQAGEISIKEILPMIGTLAVEAIEDAENDMNVSMALMGAGMIYMATAQKFEAMAPQLEAVRGTTVKDFIKLVAGDNLSIFSDIVNAGQLPVIDMNEIKKTMRIYRMMGQISPEKYNVFFDAYMNFMPNRLGAFLTQFYTDDEHRIKATTAMLDFYKNSTDQELRSFVVEAKIEDQDNARGFMLNLDGNAYLNRVGAMDIADFSKLLLNLRGYVSPSDIDNAAGSLLPAAKSVAQAFADSNFEGLMQTADVQDFLKSLSSVLQGVEILLSDAGVLPIAEEIAPLGRTVIKRIEKTSGMPVNPAAKAKFNM